MKKSGSHFDLAIALGLLLETNQLKFSKTEEYCYVGELSLNASLRSCAGILPMTIAAKKAGIRNIIVPIDNVREASLVKGINIFGFDALIEYIVVAASGGYNLLMIGSPGCGKSMIAKRIPTILLSMTDGVSC